MVARSFIVVQIEYIVVSWHSEECSEVRRLEAELQWDEEVLLLLYRTSLSNLRIMVAENIISGVKAKSRASPS